MPFDIGSQHTERKASLKEESDPESDGGCLLEASSDGQEEIENAAEEYISPWVDKATEEAQLTRVKRHCCLVSLGNLQANEDVYTEEGSSKGTFDYHVAIQSISSGSRECLCIQQHNKRYLSNRVAPPVDLYDGGTDSDDELRRESHISQGFITYGNRINFVKTNHNRILVTGGAGFIGSRLVAKLIENGQSVIVLDNLLTGSLSNLRKFDGHPGLVYINHDILNPLPKRLVVDEVYHLACPSSPFFLADKPRQYVQHHC